MAVTLCSGGMLVCVVLIQLDQPSPCKNFTTQFQNHSSKLVCFQLGNRKSDCSPLGAAEHGSLSTDTALTEQPATAPSQRVNSLRSVCLNFNNNLQTNYEHECVLQPVLHTHTQRKTATL